MRRSLNRAIKLTISAWVSLMLTSCAQNPFDPIAGQPPIENVYTAIDDSIKTDDSGSMKTIPADVNQALLPTLGFQNRGPAQKASKRFDIAVNNLNAREFFMSLVKDTDYNMIVSPSITGTISLDLKNVTFEGVLEAIRDTYGYDYELTPYGYQISADGLKTRMFTVNYINVDRKSTSEIRISSGDITSNNQNTSNNAFSGTSTTSQTSDVIPSAKVSTKADSNFWVGLQTSLEAMLADKPNRKIILNPDAGLVIVRAHPVELDQIGEYLDGIQQNMARQVLIEAKIVEVELNDAYQAGIDWKILGAVQDGTAAIVNPADIPLTDTLDAFSNIFTLTATGGSQFSTVIELLSAQGNVQVLSSPRISTLNQQKAVIKVGYDEFFITNVSNTATSSAATTDNTQDIELTPFFSGIALDVTPQINKNGNVILHIHPIVSNVYDQNKKFVVSGQAQDLPLALSIVRESDSIVEAKNGQIIIIGGLMEEKMEEYSASTPFLNKIPFAGNMFRKTNQKSRKTELVILLKPIIVENGIWAKHLQNQKDRYELLDRGYHFGDRYEVFGNMAEFPRKY